MDQAIENGMEKERRRLRGLSASEAARQGGMTLTEIMVVVIIMALIATGVALAVLPRLKEARVRATRADIRVVQSAATMWLADNTGCPSIDQLGLSRGARTKDAWDNDFIIKCDGEEPTVTSNGPDGEEGTEDDIQ